MKIRQAKQRVSPSSPRPNPFAGADDIYITKSKIAVTKTINRKTKRGFTKSAQTQNRKRRNRARWQNRNEL